MTRRTKLAFSLGVGLAVALAAIAILWPYRSQVSLANVRDLARSVAGMGPLIFFGCMATLPLVWVPVSPFLLLAPAFGTGTAIAGSLLALTANMTLAWLVSGKWFRPFFERLVGRFGYSVPRVSGRSMLGFALLLRLTPGVPFPLQNYLLGLAGMPFGKYMMASVPTNGLACVSVILFGEALMKGSGGLAMLALVVFVAVALLLRAARQRLRARSIEDGSGGVV